MSEPTPKRPLGITLVGLAMAWLGFAAFMNALVFPRATPEFFPAHVLALAVAYGFTALATTVGLWRMRSWALTAFRAWGVVCLLLMISFLLVFRVDLAIAHDPAGQLVLLAIFCMTVIAIYWLVHRYIRRRVVSGG
jgi:uncharacterized membrane protein